MEEPVASIIISTPVTKYIAATYYHRTSRVCLWGAGVIPTNMNIGSQEGGCIIQTLTPFPKAKRLTLKVVWRTEVTKDILLGGSDNLARYWQAKQRVDSVVRRVCVDHTTNDGWQQSSMEIIDDHQAIIYGDYRE